MRQPRQNARESADREYRATMLAVHVFLRGKSLQRAALDLNIPANTARQLAESEAYKDFRERQLRQLGIAQQTWGQEVTNKLQQCAPLAAERLYNILLESVNEKVVASVAGDILDRTGFPKQHKVEAHHTLELAPEVIDLLIKADREVGGHITLPRSDWSYASERPVDEGVRQLQAKRGVEGEVTTTGPSQYLLHGEGSHRVQGSRSGPSPYDGPMDSKRGEEEAGFSPT